MAPEMMTSQPGSRPYVPTVASAPADVAKMIASAMQTWDRRRAIDEVVSSIATGIADAVVAGYRPDEPKIARYAHVRELQKAEREAELAERAAPALAKIEQAGRTMIGRTVIRLGDDSDCPRYGTVISEPHDERVQVAWDGEQEPALEPIDDLMPRGESDPFRGIPNADDSDNEPM